MQSANDFWIWFEQNNKPYLFLRDVDPDTKERLLNNFMTQLHKHCDELYFEIGGHPQQDRELIITAEGNTDYFEQVENLINAAPKIVGWNFIAFIPPREVDFEMKYEDVQLKPKEMWFQPLDNSKKLAAIGIKVCMMNFELVKDSKWLQPAVYKILDTIVGEKSFAMDIDYVAIGQLSDEPEEDGMISLVELPDYIKRKKAKYGQ